MDLKTQLEHLDTTLLGSVTASFPQPLSEADRASTNAYLVLAHAVLEEHLESIFERHYDRLAGWLSADLVPLEAARLAYSVGAWSKESATSYKKRSLHQEIAIAARRTFMSQISQNNGLKAENVQVLAKWIGLQWEDFENRLTAELADLTTLGVKRGAAGHLSPYTEKVTALTSNVDPDEVRRWVDEGFVAVSRIEAYLDGLVRSQQPSTLISNWDGN